MQEKDVMSVIHDYSNDVKMWHLENEKFKKAEADHKKKRNEFYKKMDEYFDKYETGRNFIVQCSGGTINVTRTERSETRWDVDKFEKVIKKAQNKNIIDSVIQKRHTLKNIDALTKFLKGFGVKWSQFQQFITTEKEINQDAVKHFNEIGEIKDDQLEGCYMERLTGVRYYTIRFSKGNKEN